MAFPGPAALASVVVALAVTATRVALRRSLPRATPAPSPRWRPADVALLLGLIGLALALRLLWLDSRPVDNDEPVGLGLASLGDWAAGTDSRLHPPLPALLMTWAGGARDLVLARSVSVLAGVATVALAFAVVRASAGRGSALLAGFWLATMPAALHTSQLARGYSLAALGVLAAHTCLWKALATGRERWFVAYSLLAAAALSTEYLTLPALLGSAAVALWSERGQRSLLVGIVGAFGAALALVAFLVPFALPTLTLGVGGGPHTPTGAGRALMEVLELLSGPVAPFNALLLVALILAAARRGAFGPRERSLLGALTLSLAAVVAFSFLTQVRARYMLQVLPLFVCVAAVSAGALGRLGVAVALAAVLGHASLLPAYYAGSAPGSELSTGRRAPVILAWLAADSHTPVAVVPEWAIAEPSWRLGKTFPGRDAGVDCPVALCLRGGRTLYGASAATIPQLLAREPRLYVWLRSDVPIELGQCGVLLREAGTTLLRCSAPR